MLDLIARAGMALPYFFMGDYMDNEDEEAGFEWDETKDLINQTKHGVSFMQAAQAFLDPCRVIHADLGHSDQEERFFCFGLVDDGVLTVRFTRRGGRIRIFGAGYWHKGKKVYDDANRTLH
jgi:uncharacterized DUF497 family protein